MVMARSAFAASVSTSLGLSSVESFGGHGWRLSSTIDTLYKEEHTRFRPRDQSSESSARDDALTARARWTIHQTGVRWINTQRQRGCAVRYQIDPQNLRR